MISQAKSSIPLWGQAWELTVMYGAKPPVVITSNAWEPHALRMTFEVLQSTLPSPWWFADINIYNFNDKSLQDTMWNATWCRLKAGFQTGSNLASVIWDGPILQVIFGREDVVDQVCTLHCVCNPIVMDSIVTFAAGVFSSQQMVVSRMAQSIGLPPIDPANATQDALAYKAMTEKQYPRGKTVFGKVGKYLLQVSNSNFMTTFRDGEKAYIAYVQNPNTVPSITYTTPIMPGVASPSIPNGVTASIIDTPQQTPFGIIFNVLLDPRLKVQLPVQVVGIDRSVLIRQIPVVPNPDSGTVTPYTSDLSFLVAQVRHIGDTRGNAWQTEVTGYSTTYAQQLLDGIFAANKGVS